MGENEGEEWEEKGESIGLVHVMLYAFRESENLSSLEDRVIPEFLSNHAQGMSDQRRAKLHSSKECNSISHKETDAWQWRR